ncbi:MAG: 5'-nucleotidase C-terminal domain-containing protein, partial [Clostridia bacterium]
GGVRASIKAGDITNNDILKVQPYGNALCVVEATGQELLNALEMGARAVPEETGAFLQVSGLSYEIHTYVPSSVKLDDNGMFVSVDGEYRVKNVKVGDAELDLTKTYTLASHDYLLLNGGDGYTMFQDNNLLMDRFMLDNQVLINYITEKLGGVVSDEYADPHGQGRIVAVAEKP